MALEEDEELSLSCGVGANGGSSGGGGGGDEGGIKAPRLPRWTRHEILVLIQGKRVAENRVRRGGRLTQEDSGQPEPKWASVSSYCRRHGVNRGPVQCRKRWSNLAGDFKKIKEWETGLKEDSDSFWVMRNDLRREKKLPGFFDKEVYDILDGTATPPPPPPPLPEALFDSGRSAAPEEGLFPDDLDKETQISTPISAPVPISEKQYHHEPSLTEAVPGDQAATMDEKQEAELGSTSSQQQQQQQQQGKKRKHSATNQETETETETQTLGSDELVKVLDRNGSMIGAHLEAQNANWKLDREERKDHSTSLIAVLSKLADALGRIADKVQSQSQNQNEFMVLVGSLVLCICL
ncbi:hypothetical protein V2J09_004086 [Rumex salicifolius]